MKEEMAKIWVFLFFLFMFLGCFFNVNWIFGCAAMLVIGLIKMM